MHVVELIDTDVGWSWMGLPASSHSLLPSVSAASPQDLAWNSEGLPQASGRASVATEDAPLAIRVRDKEFDVCETVRH